MLGKSRILVPAVSSPTQIPWQKEKKKEREREGERELILEGWQWKEAEKQQ